MSFIDSNLLKDETVLYRARLHWFFLARDVLVCSLLMLLLIGFVLLPIFFVYDLLLIKTSEFAVTNKRVICKTGIISRYSFDTLIARVEGFSVTQGVIGRMFGFGSIAIRATGGWRYFYKNIADPLDFKRAVQNQMEVIAAETKEAKDAAKDTEKKA